MGSARSRNLRAGGDLRPERLSHRAQTMVSASGSGIRGMTVKQSGPAGREKIRRQLGNGVLTPLSSFPRKAGIQVFQKLLDPGSPLRCDWDDGCYWAFSAAC